MPPGFNTRADRALSLERPGQDIGKHEVVGPVSLHLGIGDNRCFGAR